jgi:hypothetical protein
VPGAVRLFNVKNAMGGTADCADFTDSRICSLKFFAAIHRTGEAAVTGNCLPIRVICGSYFRIQKSTFAEAPVSGVRSQPVTRVHMG